MSRGDKSILIALVAMVVGAFVLYCVMLPEIIRDEKARARAAKKTAATRPAPFVVPAGGSPLAAELNAPASNAKRDVEILHDLVGQLLVTVKEPHRPMLGSNEDIAKALTGHNRLHVDFIPAGHPALNDHGQLVDRWGSPYFFHPRAADAIDVRSAGPDRTLFTADDISNPWKS